MRSACALLLFAAGCTSAIEAVDPTLLSCTSDVPEDLDVLPCPESHRCAAPRCVPRLGCAVSGAVRPGCDPDRSCELHGTSCERCEAAWNGETSYVSCVPGVHTSTSVRPADASCSCPDGTYCTAFAADVLSSYPLFVLPAGQALPIGQLGIQAEAVEYRLCARACANEVDCPAGHTCRAAAVVQPSLLLQPTSTRNTIGVCYPNLVVPTSTTVALPQPDPLACRQHEDCPSRITQEPCRQRVQLIADHPLVPGGAGWGVHRALIGRCETDDASGLKAADSACMVGTDCKSGVCVDGTCGKPCNPEALEPCPSNRGCNDTQVERTLPDGSTLVERLYLCSART